MNYKILDLSFSNYHHPELTELSVIDDEKRRKTLPFDERCPQSGNSSLVATISLLLLTSCSNAREDYAILSGDAGSPAETLFRDIEKGNSILNRVIAEWIGISGTQVIIRRFCPITSIFSVMLDRHVTSGREIRVKIDGHYISHPEDIVSLIRRMEDRDSHTSSVKVAPSSLFPLHSSEEIKLQRCLETPTSLSRQAARTSLGDKSTDELIRRLKTRTEKYFLIQKLQRVKIDIFSPNGDTRITLSCDVVNAGRFSQGSRAHQFWFEQNQENVEWECSTDDGIMMEVEEVESKSQHREVKIIFPRKLNSLERLKYNLSYTIRREFKAEDKYHFYYFSPRIVTNLLSFEVVIPKGYGLSDTSVSHETADGFLRDDAPLISIAPAGDRQSLKWQINSPRPGDLFRTFWCYGLRDRRESELPVV